MSGLVGRRFTLTIGGRERELRLGMNAICEAERLTGLRLLFGIGVEPWSSAMVLRALVWAGINSMERGLPEDKRTTLEQVGDMIDEAGAGDVAAQIMELWVESMPEVGEGEEEDEEADPSAVPFQKGSSPHGSGSPPSG